MKKFEYKTIKVRHLIENYDYIELDEVANKMGSVGWEMINVIIFKDLYNRSFHSVTCFFKREIE